MEQINSKSINKSQNAFRQILMWSLILSPIFSMYISPLPGVDFSTFVFLIEVPFIFYFFRQLKLENFYIVVFLLYVAGAVIFSLMSSFENTFFTTLTRSTKLVYNAVACLILFPQILNLDKSVNALRYFCIVCTMYILLQTFVYYVFSYKLPPFIAKLTKEDYSYLLDQTIEGLYRPTSFFYEPAHYSQVMIFCVALDLFYNKKKPRFFEALFLTIGIVASTSGIGLLFSGISWGIGGLYYFLGKDQRLRERVTYIGVIVIIAFGLFCMTQTGRAAIERLFTVGGSDGAISYRLLVGIDVFKEIPIINQIFGCGYGNYNSYIYGFCDGFSYLLIGTGVVGMFFMLIAFYNIARKGDVLAKVFITEILALLTMADIVNLTFTVYLYFLISYTKQINRDNVLIP